ncbi:hypothetical protein MKCMC460_63180 (plasmid) [Mycobacterium sp. 20KCMC460]|nr:hypothetical protein [Mycobacterium sp. 20KCMC460]BDE17458.1 hypothetical protein MKCMC460_63180 [Mycobacterium sp. 20KCMC460]GLC23038.1 hypothetical protein SRL2020472_56090 [Mycobacterium kiyosense]
MAGQRQWVVHPNRSEPGPDEPGRNGHFRAEARTRKPVPSSTCRARVELPQELLHLADPDGAVTFGGYDWSFVVGAAHTFARLRTEVEVPPPFGFKFKRNGPWHWWDGTTTAASILEGADAAERVRPFLEQLFPGAQIKLADLRYGRSE